MDNSRPDMVTLDAKSGSLRCPLRLHRGTADAEPCLALEARALAKYDLGDTRSNTSVGFVNYASRACIESAERGAMGLELGAGISMPVGHGSIFTDGTVELRSDYTNFNTTVGYRIQF